MAGLSLKTALLQDNYQFEWSGYNDSMPQFIKETFEALTALDLTKHEEVFNQVKEKMQKDYGNFYLSNSYQQAFSLLEPALVNSSFEKLSLLKELDNFTFQDFLSMNEKWLKNGYLLSYGSGNISKDNSLQLS